MNCTTKVRSICTDKSMKNSGVHHWNHSACTDEQVNCPFCLLWERCLKPIFPRHKSQPYVLEKKSTMEIILAHWYWNLVIKMLLSHRKADLRSRVSTMVDWEIPSSPSKQHCSLARGPEPITAEHNVAGCSLQMHFNTISSDDPEARCHWLLNNFLEASSGHCGNYLYVRPLKDMSTHGTSGQPAP